MLELTSNGRPVALAPGTSVQLELNSALFDEDVVRGNFTYSFNVPAPPNGPLYGFPERPDYDQPAQAELPAALSLDGLPLLAGTQQVRSANERQYSVTLGGGLSGLAGALTSRKLHTFQYGGFRSIGANAGYSVFGANFVSMPFWALHANDVVAHPEAYDYVFAPVRCENFSEDAPTPPVPAAGSTPPAPTLPPLVINAWIQNAGAVPAALGLPLGGTFAACSYRGYQQQQLYTLNILNSQGFQYEPGPVEVLPARGQLMCPWPRLRYVLRCIFEESGLRVDDGRFLPGELAELVIVSPCDAERQVTNAAGQQRSGFYLADVLPDLTVADLLNALRKGLGLVIDVDAATGLVYSRLLCDVVASRAANDWTALLAGGAELTYEPPKALKLVYEVDGDDQTTKDLLSHPPDPATLGPAVQALADLPALGVAGQAVPARLVRDQGAYYQPVYGAVTAGAVALTWVYQAPQLDGLEVGGPDGEKLGQGFAYTQVGRVPFRLDPANGAQLNPVATEYAEVPAMSRRGYRPADFSATAPPRPTALRLLFWRGLQPASDGTLYPLLTPLATNQAGAAVGSLSLRIGGPTGTYQQLLRGWLEVKRRNVVLKANLRLSSLDLARLDLSRKVRLDDVEYLVRKLSVSVPLARPAAAELVRV